MDYPHISHAYILSILFYDPQTGIFKWRERTPDMFTDGGHSKEHNCAAWNAKFANKEAGCLRDDGYFVIRLMKRCILSHQLAWFYVYKKWPIGFLDHIDEDKSNNKIENLRQATNAQNMQNRGPQKNNKSGYKGVSYRPDKRKFSAEIYCNKKKERLGYFETAEEAHEAYCRAAKKLHGKFANFG